MNSPSELYISPYAKTKERFVEQAREVWGDKYDYTNSIYISGKKPINIYCPKHDYVFCIKMAQNHILKSGSPTGCPICAAEKLYHCNYDKDWNKYLEFSTKNNIARKIGYTQIQRKKEQRKKENAIRKAKAEEKGRKVQEYLEKWKAKNIKEAHFLEKLQKYYPNMYGTELVDYKNNDTKVTLICPEHGPFRITSRQLFGGKRYKPHGCWKCSGLVPPEEKSANIDKGYFLKEMQRLYGDTIVFPDSDYNNLFQKVTGVCSKHGNITHPARHWLEGKGCEYCNGKLFPSEWIKNAQAVHGDKYKYVGDAPTKAADFIHYICPEHGLQKQRYDVHVKQGCKCPRCSGYTRLPLEFRREKFLKDFKKKHGTKHYLVTGEDYQNNDTPIKVRCLIHNYDFKTTPDTLLRGGGGCPYCSSSEGESTILGWLTNHNIEHVWHYQIPNNDFTLPLYYLEADFFVPAKNKGAKDMIIEFHGEQHFHDIPFFYKNHKIRNLALQRHRDEYLRRYCLENDILLLEIRYDQIKNISEILNKAFKTKYLYNKQAKRKR